MVHSQFSDRLRLIMNYNSLNASSFAQRIDVGRSSMSHLLSGRNKPSLDFILSVERAFKDVDLYWLLHGKGSYPSKRNIENASPELLNPAVAQPNVSDDISQATEKESDSLEDRIGDNKLSLLNDTTSKKGKKLLKVILLYDDGTFENFKA